MLQYLNREIEELIRHGYEKFYIYPFGNIGMTVKRILEERFGCTDIVLIDNRLCKWNRNIIESRELDGKEWGEREIVLVASDHCDFYMDMRLELKKYVPDRKIKDLFPLIPFIKNKEDGRIASLAASSREIYRKDIKGNVAEGGVYRGDFAKYINVMFPDRKLYLFDSFTGFDSGCVVPDCDNCRQTDQWIDTLKDTSVDIVMKKMRFPDQVVIKKGYLPETAKEITDRFCFVNLDMDLYAPTYESLHFFWDHLSDGGYIFVHDFYVWDGVEAAVTKFCKEKNIGYVCLTDACSVAVSKPIGS